MTQRPPSSSHCQDGGQVGAEEGRQVGKGIGSRFCVSKCSNDYGVLSSRGKSVALGVCIICNPGVQAPSLAVGNALPRASGGGNTFSVGAKLHVTSFIPLKIQVIQRLLYILVSVTRRALQVMVQLYDVGTIPYLIVSGRVHTCKYIIIPINNDL